MNNKKRNNENSLHKQLLCRIMNEKMSLSPQSITPPPPPAQQSQSQLQLQVQQLYTTSCRRRLFTASCRRRLFATFHDNNISMALASINTTFHNNNVTMASVNDSTVFMDIS